MTGAAPLLLLLLALAAPSGGPGWRQEEVRAGDGTHPVRIWRLEGREPGPTLLVLGGIHGDEPGGYLTADYLVERIALARGRIVLVPRSNLPSIVAGRRGVDGDLNRAFGREDEAHPVIRVLEGLMGEADALLNLHDGWGYYREAWVSKRENPGRFGQTIVADTDLYTTAGGVRLELEAMALRVLSAVNRHIPDPEHHFHFLNTRTDAPDSRYADLVHSATYVALTRHGIPAFGVETSKNLPSDATRVRYQLLVVKAFLEEFGLEEDPVPEPVLPEARMDFLMLRLGEGPLHALRPGETLEVELGATVEVAGVEASVERGLVVDVVGRGGLDDVGSAFEVGEPLEIRVHHDARLLGSVTLRPRPRQAASAAMGPGLRPPPPLSGGPLAFRAEVNGVATQIAGDQMLEVRAGDTVRLLDPKGRYDPRRLTLDLVGFPGGRPGAPHEDRGYLIRTPTQLLDQYALLGRGEYYRVRAREGEMERGGFYLRVLPARLLALTLERSAGGRERLEEGQRLRVERGEVLTIQGVETTVPGNEGILVNFKGFAGGSDGEDRGLPVRTDRDLQAKWAVDGRGRLYEIVVMHHELPIGRVLVEILGQNTISEAER